MHWIYLLSSDTKWDDLYIFKLEVNPLWQRDKEVTWGSPFWETSIEITVLWSSDMSLQIAYQLYSGMILEEVIKQMVVIKKMRWWWWCWWWCWWWWCCSLKNPMIILTKNNTDVAGNGKEHQVNMILSCLFLPLGFYGNAMSLSWSESLRGRLHSALAEVWSEGTKVCDQTTGNDDLATASRTVTNEPGQ